MKSYEISTPEFKGMRYTLQDGTVIDMVYNPHLDDFTTYTSTMTPQEAINKYEDVLSEEEKTKFLETYWNAREEAQKLLKQNSIEYTRRKLIEECAELIQELIKKDTKCEEDKPRTYSDEHVYKEMGDVYIRLNALMDMTSSEKEIARHQEEKYKDIIRYKREGYKEF